MGGKSVLITGAAGFIGSALVRELEAAGHETISYDNYAAGKVENIATEGAFLVEGDILSMSKLLETFSAHRPDVVYHLAAEPFIPYGFHNPERFLQTNVVGTMNVLTASKTFNVGRVVVISSSEIYGTKKGLMDENHPTLPHSSYAVSKLAADRLSDVLSREQGIPVVIARPFNAFGPRECQPYIIPELIRQIVKKDAVVVGNTAPKRDFTYVHDTAKALVALMDVKTEGPEVFNIGTGVSWSVSEIGAKIAQILGKHPKMVMDKTKFRPHDVDNLVCCANKLKARTGWKPTVSFEDGLKKTIEWYRTAGRWPYEVP